MLAREADKNFTLGVTRGRRAPARGAHRAGGAGSKASPAHVSGLSFLNLDFSIRQRIKWKNVWKVSRTGRAHSLHPNDETSAGAGTTILITITALTTINQPAAQPTGGGEDLKAPVLYSSLSPNHLPALDSVLWGGQLQTEERCSKKKKVILTI